MKRIVALCALGSAITLSAREAAATSYLPGSLDETTANGRCSLREAVMAIATQRPVDTCPAGEPTENFIVLSAGTYTQSLAGELAVSGTVTIRGAGQASTTISRAKSNQGIFHVLSGARLTIEGVALTDSGHYGVGIEQGGSLILIDSSIKNCGFNTIGNAGILNAGGSAYLSGSSILDNKGYLGGGIFNSGSLVISRSLVSGNYAEHGGGIFSTGDVSITSSTISENSSFEGSAMFISGGTMAMSGTTVAFNKLTRFERNGAIKSSVGSSLIIEGSIVSKNFLGSLNTDESNCFGPVFQSSHNLMGQDCAQSRTGSDIIGVDPKLDTALSAAGGRTNGGYVNPPLPLVHRLLPGSPAIDKAGSLFDGTCQDVADQRIFKRGDDGDGDGVGGCDIGAFEVGAVLLVGGNPASSPTASDKLLKDRLEKSFGHIVTLADDNGFSVAQANQKTMVIVSESVTSANINTLLKGVPIPVMVLEPALFDDMGMAGVATIEYGTTAGQTMVKFPVGTKVPGVKGQVTVTNSMATFGWFKLSHHGPFAGQIIGAPTQTAMDQYSWSDKMADGKTFFPALRQAFFATEATVPLLNSTGWLLFDALVADAFDATDLL